MRTRFYPGVFAAGILACLLTSLSGAPGAENAPPVPSDAAAKQVDAETTLRAYLQVQEQLHATRQALEQLREESDNAAKQNAELLSVRLKLIEQAISTSREQRQSEISALKDSNRAVLWSSGLCAGIGMLAMALTAFLQVRATNRLSESVATWPGQRPLIGGPTPLMLDEPGSDPAAGALPAPPNQFRATIENLERRIAELEHLPGTPLNAPGNGAAGKHPAPGQATNGTHVTTPPTASLEAHNRQISPPGAANDQLAAVLEKGHALLNGGKTAEALACFDDGVRIDAASSEAWMRRGMALEQLQRLDDAVACYDRALALDKSLTSAWLYKGGICTRLERFNEACECYEQALKTQERKLA